MARLIASGHLGNKTPGKGGFYKTEGKGSDAKRFVLDPKSGDYRPQNVIEIPEVVKQMRALHRVGRYRDAMDVFATAPGKDADLMRRIILGYVSYGLGRVGEVVRDASGVDRIMGSGFNWAPPGLLVDIMGPARTARLMQQIQITVPPVITVAAAQTPPAPLFTDPHVDHGRFFVA
jgi:3-hydroxyacyl-CoA dehydrogenase